MRGANGRAWGVLVALAWCVGAATSGGCSKTDVATGSPGTTPATASKALVGRITTTSGDPSSPEDTSSHESSDSPDESSTTTEAPLSPLNEIYAFRSEHLVSCEAPTTPVRIAVGVSTDSDVELALALDQQPIDVPTGGDGDIPGELPCDGATHTLTLTVGSGDAAVTITHPLPTKVISPPKSEPTPPQLAEFGLDNEARHCPFDEPTVIDYGVENASTAKAELDGTPVPGVQVVEKAQLTLDIGCDGPPTRVLSFELANEVLTWRYNDTILRVPS